MDPALTDRTTQAIVGISHTDQPVRPMTVPGIEQSVHARILSTDLRGASTRFVILESGWGSRLAGAFTASVEVFVLKGDLMVGSTQLTDYEYALIPRGGVIGGFRTETGAIVLLMTWGPVRYDTSSGGAAAGLVVGRPAGTNWARESLSAELFVCPLASSDLSQVWLGSTRSSAESDVWHLHPHEEETFLLEGAVGYKDQTDDGSLTTTATPGSYFYRPAGARHTAPVPVGEETALAFHRSLGPHESDLTDAEAT